MNQDDLYNVLQLVSVCVPLPLALPLRSVNRALRETVTDRIEFLASKDTEICSDHVHTAARFKNVRRLRLSGQYWHPETLGTMAEAAPRWRSLLALDLSRNSYFGPKAAFLLRDVAHYWPLLKEVNLECCDFGPSGAATLAAAVACWRCLESLNITGNRIGDIGAAALAHSAPNLPNLQSLKANWNGIGPDGATTLAAAAQHWPLLSRLELRHNALGASGLAVLGGTCWDCMQVLNLGCNGFGPDGAKILAEAAALFPRLLELDVSGNGIGDAGALSLARAAPCWNVLERLLVDDNMITVQGAVALAGAAHFWLGSLRVLDVGGNSGLGAGMAALRQAYPMIDFYDADFEL
jgi:Ran GTPase-activating protein (RanGAP) involved in mRNA processing and transport